MAGEEVVEVEDLVEAGVEADILLDPRHPILDLHHLILDLLQHQHLDQLQHQHQDQLRQQ